MAEIPTQSRVGILALKEGPVIEHDADTAIAALQALVARGLLTLVDDSEEPRYCMEPLALAQLFSPAPDHANVTSALKGPGARTPLSQPGACSPRRRSSE
jgi:hypothetical protein